MTQLKFVYHSASWKIWTVSKRGKPIFMSEKLWNGWQGLVVLILVVLVPDFYAAKFASNFDLGGFIFVTLHFVLLPIYCVIHAGMTIKNLIRDKSATNRFFNLISITLSLSFILIFTSGNIWLTELLKLGK